MKIGKEKPVADARPEDIRRRHEKYKRALEIYLTISNHPIGLCYPLTKAFEQQCYGRSMKQHCPEMAKYYDKYNCMGLPYWFPPCYMQLRTSILKSVIRETSAEEWKGEPNG